jgi:hypothetical protein
MSNGNELILTNLGRLWKGQIWETEVKSPTLIMLNLRCLVHGQVEKMGKKPELKEEIQTHKFFSLKNN